MAQSTSKSYSTDPTLYLYTSLTSGSSHIVTATSRMETILKANRIPFKALDIATDEKARMLWGRRAGKDESGRARKIPGLVQMGLVIGDIVEVEEWNEFGELKDHVTIYHEGGAPPKPAVPTTSSGAPSKAPASQVNTKENNKAAALGPPKAPEEPSKSPASSEQASITIAMKQLGQEAAQKAKDGKKAAVEPLSGVGKAEPVKKDLDESAAKPTPSTLESSIERLTIDTPTLLQSSTSSAWNVEVHGETLTPKHPDKLESLQSPKSTAWKTTAEESKKVEEEETSSEEDEDDDEDEDDGED